MTKTPTKQSTEDLTDAELDKVSGGFSFGVEREVKTDITKKDGKLGWSTSGDADIKPTK